MARVPTSVSDLMSFCNQHAAQWTPSPTALGITAGDVTKLKTLIAETATALTAQVAAKEASKYATMAANGKVSELRKTIGNLVRTIVSFAEAQTDPEVVFTAAQLEPNAPRTPSVPPGQPTDMTATLDTMGNITLKWACANPPGGNVLYTIMRKSGEAGEFAQVGVVGKREFTDQTIPGGSSIVIYQIRGIRGQTMGLASFAFSLTFGHGGGGGFAIKTEAATPTPATPSTLKVAA